MPYGIETVVSIRSCTYSDVSHIQAEVHQRFHILHQHDELIKIYENPKLIKNTLTFNGAGVGSMGGDDITTDEELRNAINNFSNCHKNGVGHLLTGKVANFSVADFYNKIRTSLKEVLDSIGNNTDISQYIVELEKLYSYC